MKPLFVPLKTEHYRLFEGGGKTHEFRKYGPRWNERTCVIGRPIVLSRGYGKADRLAGKIVWFAKVQPKDIGGLNRIAMRALYGDLDFEVADIGIELNEQEQSR